MGNRKMFTGSIVALITPFHNNGSIDFISLRNLVNFHIQSGSNGIVVAGTTGESIALTQQEHIEIIMKTLEFANGKIPIIANTGSSITRNVIRLNYLLRNSGVAGCLSITPYYNKPTQEGLYQHYKNIALNTDIPQILYNVPSRTTIDLLPKTVARLSNIDNIVALKDATGHINRVALHRQICNENFTLLSGHDKTNIEFCKLGGQGIISVTSNILPKTIADMMRYIKNQEYEKATRIAKDLSIINQALTVESNPIPVKWAAKKIGLILNHKTRLPLTQLSKKFHCILMTALNNII